MHFILSDLKKKKRKRNQENTEYNLAFSQLILHLTDFYSLNLTCLSISGREKDLTKI